MRKRMNEKTKHKRDFVQFDERIVELFMHKGIKVDEALLKFKSDLSDDVVYCDAYTVFLNDGVASLFVSFGVEVDEDTSVFARKKTKTVINELGYKYYPISEIESSTCDQLVGNVRLILNLKNGDREILLYSTNKYSKAMFGLNDAINNFIKDGTVPEKKETNADVCPKCGTPYADKKKKICMNCVPKTGLVKKCIPFLVKYKFQIFLIFLTVGINALLNVFIPYLSGSVLYDKVLSNTDNPLYGKILLLTLAIAFANLLTTISVMINNYITAKVSAYVTYDLKKTIFESFERLSYSFFTSRHTGKLMTQINADATSLYSFFCDGIPYFVTNIAVFIFIGIIMLSINPFLALIAFFPMPALFLLFYKGLKGFKRLYADNFNKSSRFNTLLSDVLSGMRIVKAFSREETEVKRFDAASNSFAQSNYKIAVRRNTVIPSLVCAMTLTTYIYWGIGGYLVIKNSAFPGLGITYGTFVLFSSYLGQIHSPLNFFATFFTDMTNCINALQRLFEIMDTSPEVEEKENAISIESFKGDIQFKNVNFSYEPGKRAITNVSFDVKAGEMLGIVGHTGAGKSTLANLLTRLYDVESGEILIDGYDIRDISFASLRKNIAIVSQETYLFRGSIMDNIRYAKPDATEDEVVLAAKAAGAHDFIIGFQDGYNTLVGYGMKSLSGGEKQRISIARAILKDPRILILDEATAAMDTKTESKIKNALAEISKNRTTITIAHRLSTLRDADNLIVIENGKVVERGTHTELLRMKGEYFKLYSIQLEALKTIGIEE